MERTRQSIAQILTERHGETDFTILDQTRLLKLQANNNQGFRTLMLWLAGLALGLGGVGLMAVSLLGVKERQSEVGLRLALGARPIFVMLQFLIETLAVASFGGLAGLTFGSLGILLLSRFTQWHIALSVQAAVAPLVICLAIAVVFGAYPAYRAARLDPIIALRSN